MLAAEPSTPRGRGPSGESESKLFQGCSLPKARQQDVTQAFVPTRGTRMHPQLAAVRLELVQAACVCRTKGGPSEVGFQAEPMTIDQTAVNTSLISDNGHMMRASA
jgi:hypothetical protein